MLVRKHTWKKSKGTALRRLRGRALYHYVEFYARDETRPGFSLYDYRGGVPVLEDPDAFDGMVGGGAGVTLGSHGFADLFPPNPTADEQPYTHAPGGWLKHCQDRRDAEVTEARRLKQHVVDREKRHDAARERLKQLDVADGVPLTVQHLIDAGMFPSLEVAEDEAKPSVTIFAKRPRGN